MVATTPSLKHFSTRPRVCHLALEKPTEVHPPPERRERSQAEKIAWLTAGWICFGIGVVGVVLPGIPTTFPMLLALGCFARGSDRMHDWLMNHPTFGPPLQRWQRDRIMPLKAKIIAVSMMTASLVYITVFSGLATWIVITTIVFIGIGLFVVLRTPHKKPAEAAESEPHV